MKPGQRAKSAVVFCVDDKMLAPALLAAEEAARFSDPEFVDVVILSQIGSVPVGALAWHGLRSSRVRLEEVDYTAHMPTRKIFNLDIRQPAQRIFNPAALFRLFLPGYFNGAYSKLLYLDADVAIIDSLDPLFAIDLNSVAVAAVDDLNLSPLNEAGDLIDLNIGRHRALLGFGRSTRYANSGVLLINADEWQRQSISERAADFLIRNHADIAFVDQDALNGALDGAYAVLSPKWNYFWNLLYWTGSADLMKSRIVHYCGVPKPWMFNDWNGPQEDADRYRLFFDALPWIIPDVRSDRERKQAKESVVKKNLREFERTVRRIRHQIFGHDKSRTRPNAQIRALIERYMRNTAFIDEQ